MSSADARTKTAIEAVQAAGLKGISVDLTLPDLVDTLANGSVMDTDTVEAIRHELDTKDAGGLKAVGGEDFLPLLYATGPSDEALAKLRDFDSESALATRLDGLAAIAGRVADTARITLDPTERHGFEYQSWFGFTIYAEGHRAALGRGGTYRIGGSDEAATGFTLYIDRMAEIAPQPNARPLVYLPTGHDKDAAAALRADGWRSRAQIGEGEDPAALGCTHILEKSGPRAL